jgi:predicted esterase
LLCGAIIGLAVNCAPSDLTGLQPSQALAASSGPMVKQALPWPAATASPGSPVLTAEGVYVPSSLDPERPVPLLLALHGVGSNGPRIAERLAQCAEQNGWVLIAPTLSYRDYMDPEQVSMDDKQDLPKLLQMLDEVQARLTDEGLRLEDDPFVYGFSRGGQLAHRFALFYPDRVAGVASLAAGTYTLPRTELAFPFGVADLSDYAGHAFDPQSLVGKPFWVGVGASDTLKEQVPRRWDPYLGSTRLERARRFVDALQGLGASAQLNVFSGAGHEETALMRQRACAFFGGLTPVHSRA